jgi:hypothetical protein
VYYWALIVIVFWSSRRNAPQKQETDFPQSAAGARLGSSAGQSRAYPPMSPINLQHMQPSHKRYGQGIERQ